nr:hypothetical protein Iba_chr05dCG6320 [Ipomoea batatas]
MPWREASLAGSSPSPPPIHHRPRYDFQSQVVLGDNTVIKSECRAGESINLTQYRGVA